MGGKTLYLKPWMEGSEFKRNVIEKVPFWIKLSEVPPTYWTRDGLSMIAGRIGRPLKFDEITGQFEPLKFARVQIELSYSAPRPPYVLVPTINSSGIEEYQRVEIEYSQLPYSCSLCKAFGHSLAICADNPEREIPQAKKPKTHSRKNNSTSQNTSNTYPHKKEKQQHNESMKAGNPGTEVGINDMEPFVIGKFAGCDVVRDEDQRHSDDILVDVDGLDDFDIAAQDSLVNPVEQEPTTMSQKPSSETFTMVCHQSQQQQLIGHTLDADSIELVPLTTSNTFEPLSYFEDEDLSAPSLGGSKRKKAKPVSITSPLKNKNIADADGFIKVSLKKSAKLASLPRRTFK
ncbi:uncharacterized protein LOC141668805 [Apium graveolens]|uniref:uncharacterized protein LOC141668805 n=1 Tax=Apium graveolens TaxID=4045 RepID=UPI003D7B5B3E